MTPLEPKIDFKGKFAPFQNCEMWAKFSGLNAKGSYLSLEKEKETFCVVFSCSAKRAREIRKFHVAVVQRWPKNAQKSVMHVQSCCFTNINLLLCLPFSLPSPSLLPKLSFPLLLWSKNFVTMVTWRLTSPLYWSFPIPADRYDRRIKNW